MASASAATKTNKNEDSLLNLKKLKENHLRGLEIFLSLLLEEWKNWPRDDFREQENIFI